MSHSQASQSSGSAPRRALFDRWAPTYDASAEQVDRDGGFPFAGRGSLHRTILDAVSSRPRSSILDLGIGSGCLAAKLLERGGRVTGVDFSAAMLARTAATAPDAWCHQIDLLQEWPSALDGPFHHIIASYVLHEFDAADKASICDKAIRRLVPGGSMHITDIMFPTRVAHDQARSAHRDQWDDAEHYWVLDELSGVLPSDCCLERALMHSWCGGLIELRPRQRH